MDKVEDTRSVVPSETAVAQPSENKTSVPLAPLVGSLSIDSKPVGALFFLRCSSGYVRKGETPVIFDDVPVGECKVELSYHNAKDQFYTVAVKGEETAQVYHEWKIETPIRTQAPTPASMAYYNWDREIVIGVIEFEPPSIAYEKYLQLEGKTFLDLLNEPSGVSSFQVGPETDTYYSLHYVDDWFKKEYERVTGKKPPSIKVEVLGPIRLKEKPPSLSKYDDCGLLKPFFESNAKSNNADPTKYDVVNYVYLDPDMGYSETSSYEGAAFQSCRQIGENTTFIATKPSIYFNGVTDAVRKVIHETSHVFGAVDTYASAGGCNDPEGIPEPNKQPKFPQSKACIMCGCVMNNPGPFSCWRPQDINQFTVCEKEARDFGWTER